jgi:hypothetical protein
MTQDISGPGGACRGAGRRSVPKAMHRIAFLGTASRRADEGRDAAACRDPHHGHVYGQTGPLEAYAAQSHRGLMLGLEYATGGTMEIDGEPIVVNEYDTQLDPDIGKVAAGRSLWRRWRADRGRPGQLGCCACDAAGGRGIRAYL